MFTLNLAGPPQPPPPYTFSSSYLSCSKSALETPARPSLARGSPLTSASLYTQVQPASPVTISAIALPNISVALPVLT